LNYFNYFSEIEELFIRRRGRNLLLSPLDWALIETWQERKIPLHIILRAIEKVFDAVDRQPAKKRTVKSLLYCREEIEAQHAAWLEMQVGKNGGNKVQSSKFKVQSSEDTSLPKSDLFSEEAIAAHLEKVSAELNAALNKTEGELKTILGKVSKHLAELRQKPYAPEKLEESLEKLDALVDESLLQNLETERIKSEIEKQIASYKNKMEREIYERTFDLMLLKRLREHAEIPRLSLFNL
jgi:transcriptional regulator NrdR family protein